VQTTPGNRMIAVLKKENTKIAKDTQGTELRFDLGLCRNLDA